MATYTDQTVIVPSDGKQQVKLGAILVLVAGIISALGAGYFYLEASNVRTKTTKLNTTIQDKETQKTALKPVADQIVQVSDQVKGLHSIFNNQQRWNSVLEKLSSHLYKNMAITNLQLAESGTLTLGGYTTDYVEYAKVYRSLTDATAAKYFTNVKPVSVQKAQVTDTTTKAVISERVEFSFTMSLSKEIITPATSVSVPAS